MSIYSTPFPCCPNCEMQADDAIPPREKRRGRGGIEEKKKKNKASKQDYFTEEDIAGMSEVT